MNTQSLISDYLRQVKTANKESTKKEHFKDLLNRLFAGHPDIMPEIDKISAGAEKAILNIPRIGRTKRGSADSQYNNVITEFENDLKKSGNHAVNQLREYFLGEVKSGNGIKNTLFCIEKAFGYRSPVFRCGSREEGVWKK